jgi:pimeloyl-ACP methyl ester carboxylesterase
MSLSAFGTLPPGVLTTPVPFALDVSHRDQNHLKRLVHDANIGPPSYYTAHTDTTSTTSFGLSRDWLITAQDVWTSHGQSYSWHDEQTRLNSLPNFRINITTSTPAADPNEQAEEQTFNLHFAALFSQSPTATPLILLHGWPGAWFEFAPLLELLATKYTPETLPYHVVVPSIPDYGLSTRSRELERELSMDEAAAALDELMVQLGFGDGGYVAQGGDIGSFLAQVMCATFDACRAFHREFPV